MKTPNTRSNGSDSFLLLLQVSNSSFPTGSFSHSYGLETLIFEGAIHSPASAEQWCRNWLRFGVACGDGIAVVAAFRRTLYSNMDGMGKLVQLVEALKIGRESRDASAKTGAAFLTACRDVFKIPEIDRLDTSLKALGMRPHHAVVYGVAGAGLGFTEQQTIETYLWSSLSNIVSVVGRLLPLGQTDIQRILKEAAPLIDQSAEIARSRDEAHMCSMNAALDAASMRHERLRTRLCIS
ncbi:urease accessory protein UreF [Hyphomicrobium sp.]|uniref:urease accessory protein UreF n=1 Tax=Hyphomicrobium sp. TaxID=82 RepID=UPI003F6F4FF7